jgi:hypothetical protein
MFHRGSTHEAVHRCVDDIVQVIRADPSNPIVWPVGTDEYFFPAGTVNVVDCQDQLLDLRNRDHSFPIEFVTNVYWRCRCIFNDREKPWATVEYWIDSSGMFPCNVRLPFVSSCLCSADHDAVFCFKASHGIFHLKAKCNTQEVTMFSFTPNCTSRHRTSIWLRNVAVAKHAGHPANSLSCANST